MQATRKSGFSLVEMSIVVAIIGLLVGSVITGRTLAENARVNRTVAEAEFFKSAYVQFQAKYNAAPGDFRNASRFFPGEQNGNGDGMLDWWSEGLRGWRHLERASMIPSGNYTGTYVVAAGVAPGKDVPTIAYDERGGYSFAFEEGTAGNNNFGIRGNVLHMGMQYPEHTTKGALFSGSVAFSLDSKLDDGNPASGFIRAWDTTWNARCTLGAVPNVTYALAADDEVCALLIQF